MTVRESEAVLDHIASYVFEPLRASEVAWGTARWCLVDSIGCGLLALNYPACKKLLGPVAPGYDVANGVKTFGTPSSLDPVSAAFNIGTMIRWLDFNDTWLAAEWGHPSDNLGAILACAQHRERNGEDGSIRLVLEALIKAYEIQGMLALENSFNRVGLDHVLLVRVASAAVAAWMLGADEKGIRRVLTHAFLDGGALRTYRHAPNTGSRKSWAAGDATSRATWLAFQILKGEMGYETPLSAAKWGFEEVILKGKKVQLPWALSSYVVENILFKIRFPAEFHAQTAVEAAIELHGDVKTRISEIDRIELETQEAGMRIISKKGPLKNPADRDHCLEYMVAIPLIFGSLTAEHYEDKFATDPRIDELRSKMVAKENVEFSKDYLDPAKRSIANSVQVFFRDGSSTRKVVVEYPVGHRRRREEGLPDLRKKFLANAGGYLGDAKAAEILALGENLDHLMKTSTTKFLEMATKS